VAVPAGLVGPAEGLQIEAQLGSDARCEFLQLFLWDANASVPELDDARSLDSLLGVCDGTKPVLLLACVDNVSTGKSNELVVVHTWEPWYKCLADTEAAQVSPCLPCLCSAQLVGNLSVPLDASTIAFCEGLRTIRFQRAIPDDGGFFKVKRLEAWAVQNPFAQLKADTITGLRSELEKMVTFEAWASKWERVDLDQAIDSVGELRNTSGWSTQQRSAFLDHTKTFLAVLDWIDHSHGGGNKHSLYTLMNSITTMRAINARKIPVVRDAIRWIDKHVDASVMARIAQFAQDAPRDVELFTDDVQLRTFVGVNYWYLRFTGGTGLNLFSPKQQLTRGWLDATKPIGMCMTRDDWWIHAANVDEFVNRVVEALTVPTPSS
jgi:hypothetical protein